VCACEGYEKRGDVVAVRSSSAILDRYLGLHKRYTPDGDRF
jgi:hypothetical protein